STGEYVGIVEQSFSMDIDKKRVRVEKEWELLYYMTDESKKRKIMTDSMNYYKKKIKTYNKNYPEFEFNIYRTGGKNCPVSIDWGRYHREKKDKFKNRNLVFIPKENI
ncbi:MAG: hypothetical protein WC755_08640, partial [Candidatus Woesearchaeota archaeon]